MIRFLIFGVVAYILYKLVANEMRRRNSGDEKAPPNSPSGVKTSTGDMVKDPVCGTYVDTDSSISIREGETVHRFCGYECRDEFLRRLQGEGRAVPGGEGDKESKK